MRPDDILDAIGNVDDECVKKAREKKKNHKAFWITLGSAAACLIIALIIPALSRFGVSENSTSNITNDTAVEETYDMAIVEDYVDIYYVSDGEINHSKKHLPLSAKDVFNAWKEQNGIGDDVKFIDVSIEDNGKTTESEVAGQTVIKHETGDYFIYNLTISKSIEDYYDTVNSELLLESLKKTMTGYQKLEYQEYNLILE